MNDRAAHRRRTKCDPRRTRAARVTRPRRCPTAHRHVTEDGYHVEKSRNRRTGGVHRVCYVLATCRDCGARLVQRYEMRRSGEWCDRESA